MEKLKNEGVRVYAVEQVQGSVSLDDFEVEKGVRYALVLGNEVFGVAQDVVGYVPRGIGGPAGRDQAFAQCGGVCRSSDLGFVYEKAQAWMRGRTIDIKRRTAQAGAALVLYA